MSDAGFANPTISYNSAGSAVTVAANYFSIFTHAQQTDCPLTQCSMNLDSDCATPLGAQTDVTLTASPDFGLSASETNPLGYSLVFCFRCGILQGLSEIFFDKVLSVTGNQVDINLGTAVAKANAVVEVTTNLLNAATGTVTTKVDVRQDVTGNQFNIGTSDVGFRKWDGIVPGATQVWTEKQPRRGS